MKKALMCALAGCGASTMAVFHHAELYLDRIILQMQGKSQRANFFCAPALEGFYLIALRMFCLQLF
jgi:hypothetical protein